MSRNKKIRAWLEMGVGRTSALAKVLNCSRQFVSKVSLMEKGISESQWNAISYGISIIELDEKSSQKKIEQIIIKAAHLSHSKDYEIKQFAQIELDKWVDALGRAA
ncbi:MULTISPECIES: hypothetical protein [unclassified Acinetobacter]|uniref:hypothetical protein n=1 Tax=unclassified Acinetobacter TaxID=196816 RepID=UPI0015D34BA4|nr:MULTISPECIES: hypothetical protein [unclassified Acinetobacter]